MLPNELLYEIFDYCSNQELKLLRSLNKEFNILIHDFVFQKYHFKNIDKFIVITLYNFVMVINCFFNELKLETFGSCLISFPQKPTDKLAFKFYNVLKNYQIKFWRETMFPQQLIKLSDNVNNDSQEFLFFFVLG